jgi:hypothetical protein
MHVEWYGQSSFALRAGDTTVFIDPFGDMSPAASRGLQFDYPPITGVDADVLLVTHEHLDHNGPGGSPSWQPGRVSPSRRSRCSSIGWRNAGGSSARPTRWTAGRYSSS